jgi:hypothetical protein
MKKRLWLFPILMMLSAAGCSKCAKMGGGESKALTVDQIGSTLAPAICEKYGSCNQNPEFNKDQCLKDIGAGITENLKQAKDLKVDQAMLDGCVAAVKGAACDALNSATPPKGCEFLQ